MQSEINLTMPKWMSDLLEESCKVEGITTQELVRRIIVNHYSRSSHGKLPKKTEVSDPESAISRMTNGLLSEFLEAEADEAEFFLFGDNLKRVYTIKGSKHEVEPYPLHRRAFLGVLSRLQEMARFYPAGVEERDFRVSYRDERYQLTIVQHTEVPNTHLIIRRTILPAQHPREIVEETAQIS